MEIKSYKHIVGLILGFAITVGAFSLFYHSHYFQIFQAWVGANKILYAFVLVFIKIIGTVWPPIPGGLFTLTAIPLLGWKIAYLADIIGSMSGASFAYFIAKRYGWDFVNKLFDAKTIDQLKRIKIHGHREIEAIFVFRIVGGGIIELVCYASGLLKIKYHNFLIGSLISHLTLILPIYYFSGALLSGKQFLLNFGLFIVFGSILYYLKNRYFVVDEIG